MNNWQDLVQLKSSLIQSQVFRSFFVIFTLLSLSLFYHIVCVNSSIRPRMISRPIGPWSDIALKRGFCQSLIIIEKLKRFLQSLELLRTDDPCSNIIWLPNMDENLRVQKVRKTGTWYFHFWWSCHIFLSMFRIVFFLLLGRLWLCFLRCC